MLLRPADPVPAGRKRVQRLTSGTSDLAPPRELGVGVVWWPAVDALCSPSEGLVDVIEVEPETFWTPIPGVEHVPVLPGVLAHLPQPKLLHGVGAPLGGTSPPPHGHTSAFARDIAALAPVFVSEHLSFTRFRPAPDQPPAFAGFMLPVLQSAAAAELAVANIRGRRAALGDLDLAFEITPSYLPPVPGEWPDGAFIAAVADAADSGIVLDLHNALCNARNHRQPIGAMLDSLPLDRVWELHLAGGESENGFYVDAHSGLAEQELMDVAEGLIPSLANLRAVVFEIMPERVPEVGLPALAGQLGALRDLWSRRGRQVRSRAPGAWPETEPALEPAEWEALLGNAVTGRPLPPVGESGAAWLESARRGLDLYRTLAQEGRASALAAAAPRTIRVLLSCLGRAGTRALLAEFWACSLPEAMAAEEARCFLRFLGERQPALPGLAEAMAGDLRLMV